MSGLPVIFHRLLSVEEAIAAVEKALGGIGPRGVEEVNLLKAGGRVLAETVPAKVDLPPYDRSEVDGYAVEASSTFGAEEDKPLALRLVGESNVGALPTCEVCSGEAAEIATGAPLPRGANAVVMVEYTKRRDGEVVIYRPVVSGENVAQTGSDVTVGDVVLRPGIPLTPREIAVLAGLGYSRVKVFRKPTVGVFSTGDELQPPGMPLQEGKIYDVNGPAVVSLARECGAEAEYLGILPDSYAQIKSSLQDALSRFDMVLTSASTSAGLGDIIYRVFNDLGKPGIVVHGLRIRPGKPTVAAVVNEKLVVGLPGFPVSAMIAFSVFVKPILSRIVGVKPLAQSSRALAKMAYRVQAGRGKKEFIPVNLVKSSEGLTAYPLLGGSGAVTTLALGDGFVEVEESKEYIEENEGVYVTLFSPRLRLADLDIIGSHCPGIDLAISLLDRFEAKIVNVGSVGGWQAVKRGEADIAGTHLLDEETLTYNAPFLKRYGLTGKAVLFRGYCRLQGFLVKKGNPKQITGFEDFARKDVVMVNRNRGSGTRALIDYHLKKSGTTPENVKGYGYEAKTHSAVAAAVAQGRADVGVAIEAVAEAYGLDFIPIAEENFDFLVPRERLGKDSVQRFLGTIASSAFSDSLKSTLKGYFTTPESGKIVAE